MDRAYVVREQIGLTLAGAQAAVAAATAKARELGVDVCIAVVDGGGALLAFVRMDGARIGSIQLALTKAASAATRRRATAEETGGDALLGTRLAVAAGGTITNIGGGLPIVVEDHVIGGVGVSSATTDEDLSIARAALSAFA
jgi:uncharacterized protein GlcG (DUF336 family)